VCGLLAGEFHRTGSSPSRIGKLHGSLGTPGYAIVPLSAHSRGASIAIDKLRRWEDLNLDSGEAERIQV
jgi:hypothetical protein